MRYFTNATKIFSKGNKNSFVMLAGPENGVFNILLIGALTVLDHFPNKLFKQEQQ